MYILSVPYFCIDPMALFRYKTLNAERYNIFGNNQLDALFHVFIYFMSLHVSSVTELIIRRSNRINISSGMIRLRECLVCRYTGITKQSLTQTNHTR